MTEQHFPDEGMTSFDTEGDSRSGPARAEGAPQPQPQGSAAPGAGADADAGADAPADGAGPDVVADDLTAAQSAVAALTNDLQRLQAEYVNYKRRVDRDRAMVQERAVQDVLETLLPVLDDIHAAREHGDLQSGPFASIAEKLEQTLTRFGLSRFGDVGEPFDPMRHEALMHTQADLPEGATETTVVTVLQPGYRAGDQVIRPARVAVADPQ